MNQSDGRGLTTYSRTRASYDERPAKKLCRTATHSSSDTISSDSPPLRPPTAPENAARELQAISVNITTPVKPFRPKSRPLRQMQIDLGGSTRRSCKLCQMSYVPSVKQDALLHATYCTSRAKGIEVGKSLARDNQLVQFPSSSTLLSASIMLVVVDRKASAFARGKVAETLRVVNTELSAATIDDKALWPRQSDRFKAILALQADRCIGLCLVEKISNAYEVISAVGSERIASSSYSTCRSPRVALLGISRIWTSTAHRKLGVALELLDCARRSYFYGIEVPKSLVAFSQPTESGGRLAQKWFGQDFGWSLYQEDRPD